MTKNYWSDEQAHSHTTLLAQRAYSSRLLGSDESLVLHGGGNTSVKAITQDIFGNDVETLLVKSSGSDLSNIQENGFTALRLAPLQQLKSLTDLSEPQMLNELLRNQLDQTAARASVETLVHAFLPHRFIDHTHADAILAITNQPSPESILAKLYENEVPIIPYCMPGFSLAQLCLKGFEQNPNAKGFILLHHGALSFGETAKESYSNMIDIVQKAQRFLDQSTTNQPLKPISQTASPLALNWIQAIRRSMLRRGFSCLLQFDGGSLCRHFVDQENLSQISQQGPLTPDHVIRTKRVPLTIPREVIQNTQYDRLDELISDYGVEYERYFKEHKNRKGKDNLAMLDSLPRVFLLPGLGVATVGSSKNDAKIALDIYQHTIQAILWAEKLGRYQALDEKHVFDVEYWGLEQSKVQSKKTLPLTGKSILITGGASGIGLTVANRLSDQGATTYVFDRNQPKDQSQNNSVTFLSVDVTDRKAVKEKVEQIVFECGGIDGLVLNAGIFPKSNLIEETPADVWQKSLDVNLTGSFHVLSECLTLMKTQGNGGDIIFIASKNVLAPGKKAAAYSVAKAGQTQLARVAALECGDSGIRVNTVHPHLILDTGIWSEKVIEQRAQAYSMTAEQYRTNNLMRTELGSKDVANAVFALLAGYFSKTTGAQIPIDGGNERTL